MKKHFIYNLTLCGRNRIPFFLLLFAVTLPVFFGGRADALSGSEFNPGRIIDDAVFYNGNAMTESQIQEFLNAKVPTCDTNGTGSYTYRYNSSTGRVNFDGSSTEAADPYVTTTRAIYGDRVANYSGDWRGSRVPYKCLKEKTFNTVDIAPESGICNGYAGASSETAARIIYKVAQSCEINPQTLIVLLQKEQSLITETWPWGIQYEKATGAFCPDNPPEAWAPKNCNPEYLGFPKQLYYGAHRFKVYKANPYNYNYVAGRYNSILWNPNAGCGRSDVFIENQATAALYIYTPYRPNPAALNNLYGNGDSCSSYGNRNFWRMWNDWFGSTYADATIASSLTLLSSVPGAGLFTDGFVEASFVIRNNSTHSNDVGIVAVACRDSYGNNCDIPGQHVILQPGGQYLYRAAINLVNEDKYTFWVTNYRDGKWNDEFPGSSASLTRRIENILVQKKPILSVDPTTTDTLRVNKVSNISFTVQNPSSYPLDMGYLAVGLISPSRKNADLAPVRVANIPAGGSYTYTQQFRPSESGNYQATVLQTPDFHIWNNATYPVPATGNDGRTTFSVKNNPTLTQGLTLDNSSPRVGDTITGTFKVKNFSNNSLPVNKNICFIVRGPNKINFDLGCLSIGTMNPDEELMFTASKQVQLSGNYTAFFSMYDGAWHDNWSFAQETGSEATSLNFSARSN